MKRILVSSFVACLIAAVAAIAPSTPAGADSPAATLLGLAGGNVLVSFNEATPGTLTSSVPVSGLQPGEHLVGIDVRPSTGQVVGIGVTGTDGRAYLIDPVTGVATLISSAPFSTTLSGSATYGVDFNPVVDRLRVVNTADANMRVNPNTGALAASDTDLNPPSQNVTGAAYDRSVAGSALSTLFGISDTGNTLVRIGGVDGAPTPNGGVLTTVGALGVAVSGPAGFDISPQGIAYASLTVSGTTSLFTINLSTGAATLVGAISDGALALVDITVLPALPAGAAQYTTLSPTRVLDTRNGVKPLAGQHVDVQISGVGGVPATGATSVVLNVTATEATDAGYVTAYPFGEERPTASNLNVVAGQTVANLVTVKLGAGGMISLFTQSGTHLVADVAGYYAAPTSAAGRYVAMSPARLADTRAGAKPAAGSTTDIQVTGVQGVPTSGVSAVVLNVTLNGTTEPGYVTAWPTGEARPLASNLNAERTDQTIANLVIVKLGASGMVSLYTQSSTHLIVDVSGYFTDGSGAGGYNGLFVPLSPARLIDTRFGTKVAANGSIDVAVGGVGSIPTTADAAILNVTITEATNPGFITVYPTGTARPYASNLNAEFAGQTIPNSVVATLGTGGAATIYSEAGTHVVVDVNGWYTG
jgi:hypothetical protein